MTFTSKLNQLDLLFKGSTYGCKVSLILHILKCSEARKSSNKPDAQKVLDNLIYNYSPTYSGNAG